MCRVVVLLMGYSVASHGVRIEHVTPAAHPEAGMAGIAVDED